MIKTGIPNVKDLNNYKAYIEKIEKYENFTQIIEEILYPLSDCVQNGRFSYIELYKKERFNIKNYMYELFSLNDYSNMNGFQIVKITLGYEISNFE